MFFILQHMVSSTAYICGELTNFNMRKIVADDIVVKNPIITNTDQTQRTTTRIMIELIKKSMITDRISLPSQTRKEISIVYGFPEQHDLKNQISEDVIRQTVQMLGAPPVLPQPTLLDAPHPLFPMNTPRPELIKSIIAQVKNIVFDAFKAPLGISLSNHNVTGKLLRVSKAMEWLSYDELEQVWEATLIEQEVESMKNAKELILDTIAMVGTNPATIFTLDKITAGEIAITKAIATIQSAIINVKTPTRELLRKLIFYLRLWRGDNSIFCASCGICDDLEKTLLVTPTLFQLSNLLYRAYVDPSTMVSNYPVRIYGIFGSKDSPILLDDYIPLLKEMLVESERDPSKEMKPVIITAIGKLGHPKALKLLVNVAQGIQGEEPMLRSLAVYSMRRLAIHNPTQIKVILLAMINNPFENADVRIAALAVLPWTKPSFAELQKIAIRSWYETSQQVVSFARSTFESLINNHEPELKTVGIKAKAALHMFKPTAYGLQYSKNFHASQLINYLLSSVNTKMAFTASKDEYLPTKISLQNNIFQDVLGAGFNINLNAYSVYSQGMENAIDCILRTREIAGEILTASPNILKDLSNIAKEVKLLTRTAPDFKAFIMARNMGFEYAHQFSSRSLLEMVGALTGAISSTGLTENLRRGITGTFITASNLFSVTTIAPTTSGIPTIDRRDFASVTAGKGSIAGDIKSLQFNAKLLPTLNARYQSDFRIISVLSESYVGNGIAASVHASVPVEVDILMTKGELDVTLQPHITALDDPTRVEVISGLVLPYTVRQSVRSIEPYDMAQDMTKILGRIGLKQVCACICILTSLFKPTITFFGYIL